MSGERASGERERRRPCGVGFVSAPAMPFSAKRLATDGSPQGDLSASPRAHACAARRTAGRVAIGAMCSGSLHESGGERRCVGGGLTAARAWLQRPVSPAAATLKAENLAMLSRSTMRAITVGGSSLAQQGRHAHFKPGFRRLFGDLLHILRTQQPLLVAMDRTKPGPGAGGSGAAPTLPPAALAPLPCTQHCSDRLPLITCCSAGQGDAGGGAGGRQGNAAAAGGRRQRATSADLLPRAAAEARGGGRGPGLQHAVHAQEAAPADHRRAAAAGGNGRSCVPMLCPSLAAPCLPAWHHAVPHTANLHTLLAGGPRSMAVLRPTSSSLPATQGGALRDATCTRVLRASADKAYFLGKRQEWLEAEERRRLSSGLGGGGSGRSIMGALARLPAGMRNLGNTCYMNAVLQVGAVVAACLHVGSVHMCC